MQFFFLGQSNSEGASLLLISDRWAVSSSFAYLSIYHQDADTVTTRTIYSVKKVLATSKYPSEWPMK
jgi:hypothetical protein